MRVRRGLTQPTSQRGIALLLSLLLMAALVAAGIGASNVVINDIRSVSTTDQSIRAQAASDAGLEQALFTIFNKRLLGANYSTTAATITSGTGALADGKASYKLNRSESWQTSKTLTIKESESAQINAYDPDDPYLALPSPTYQPIRYLTLYAPDTGCPSGSTCPRALVRWTYIQRKSSSTGLVEHKENSIERILSNTALAAVGGPGNPNGVQLNLIEATMQLSPDTVTGTNPSNEQVIDPNRVSGWIVNIKALNGPLVNLEVTGQRLWGDPSLLCTDVNSAAYCFQDELILRSLGESQGSRHLLEARVPWELPATGLFDYVIFSEETLDKASST